MGASRPQGSIFEPYSSCRDCKDFIVLDVGYGGGRTIEKLAMTATHGKVSGVDYAAGSVAVSRSRNKNLIEAGRLNIRQASVSDLPFAANAFNLLVTAIETQYYWPDLPNDMREILSVLKPGGTLAVVAETYKGGSRDVVLGTAMRLFGSPSLGVKEHRELFLQVGYTDVEVFENGRKVGFALREKSRRRNQPMHGRLSRLRKAFRKSNLTLVRPLTLFTPS